MSTGSPTSPAARRARCFGAPRWRDELPTRVRRAAGDRRIPNPAVVGLDEPDGATANTVYCWVWTRESYRAPTFPFGHHTLWSVTVGQTFAYDGHNVVAVSRPTVRPDTTRNGFRWFADGAAMGLRHLAAVLGARPAHVRALAEDGNLVDPMGRPHPQHRPPAHHRAR